jgi:RNA polymerase sigma-70 factor (ECF subfamily)
MSTALHCLSDRDLMGMVKLGQREAFEILVCRYQRALLNFFSRMGANIGDAEDMVQETFLRVFKYRFKYRPLAKFTTFLYTLARHT